MISSLSAVLDLALVNLSRFGKDSRKIAPSNLAVAGQRIPALLDCAVAAKRGATAGGL